MEGGDVRLGASIGRADQPTLTRPATDCESAGIDILWVAARLTATH
jgi:hypothetical protein